jgi:hypothetical protein
MAVGNLGSALTQLQGFIASEFNASSTQEHNQGLSLLPEIIRTIASRADLGDTNLRVTAPRLFDGTNDVTVETGAVHLIAVVAQANTSQLEDGAVLTYEAAVTEGTTRYTTALNVDSSSTAGVPRAFIAVYPEPIPMAALYWSVVDNGADTDIEGTTLGDASGMRVMLVYSE